MDVVWDDDQIASFDKLMCCFAVATMLVMSLLVPSLITAQDRHSNCIADETNPFLETNGMHIAIFIPPEYLGHALIIFRENIRSLLGFKRLETE